MIFNNKGYTYQKFTQRGYPKTTIFEYNCIMISILVSYYHKLEYFNLVKRLQWIQINQY